MPAHLELRVQPAKEVHTLGLDIYLASIPAAVQATKAGVIYEFLCRLFRQIAVTARNVHPANTEFTDFSVCQWLKSACLKNHISHVRKWRSYGDGFSGT